MLPYKWCYDPKNKTWGILGVLLFFVMWMALFLGLAIAIHASLLLDGAWAEEAESGYSDAWAKQGSWMGVSTMPGFLGGVVTFMGLDKGMNKKKSGFLFSNIRDRQKTGKDIFQFKRTDCGNSVRTGIIHLLTCAILIVAIILTDPSSAGDFKEALKIGHYLAIALLSAVGILDILFFGGYIMAIWKNSNLEIVDSNILQPDVVLDNVKSHASSGNDTDSNSYTKSLLVYGQASLDTDSNSYTKSHTVQEYGQASLDKPHASNVSGNDTDSNSYTKSHMVQEYGQASLDDAEHEQFYDMDEACDSTSHTANPGQLAVMWLERRRLYATPEPPALNGAACTAAVLLAALTSYVLYRFMRACTKRSKRPSPMLNYSLN